MIKYPLFKCYFPLFHSLQTNKKEIMSDTRGFTLAETLITLVIIGVVAAITIPTLFVNFNDEEAKAALKKNYSVFKNAFEKLRFMEGEDYSNVVVSNGKISETRNIKNDLGKYMIITKYCGHAQGCFPDKIYKKNGELCVENPIFYNSENIAFSLNDGTLVLFTVYAKATIAEYKMGINANRLNSNNFIIYVDVNGLKKPNTNGKDIFYFVLTKDGLLPAGYDNKSAYCDDISTENRDCAAKMLIKRE